MSNINNNVATEQPENVSTVEDNNVNATTVEENITKEKTFTQEEVDKMIKQRLAREKKDIAEKIEAERQEAEKLAKMSEREKQQALLDKREKALAEREAALDRANLLNETTKQLSSKNLPIEFADFLMAQDAETTFNRLSEFEMKWNTALETAVNARLKGNAPAAATSNKSNGSLTIEDVKAMSAVEIQRRWNEVQEALKKQ